MKRTLSKTLRRPKEFLSPYITSYVQEQNPLTVLWWSAAFPGAGHFMLCKYMSGGLLMVWEYFINAQANINQGIFYSLIGEFEMAKTVVDIRWFLLYMCVYIFTMWDSYSLTINLNKYSFTHLKLTQWK